MTQHPEPALVITNLSHDFDGEDVLRDVNLVVNNGSITALLGPSGVGKTTLLRIIAGFVKPRTGQISIAGQVAVDDTSYLPAQRRGIAIVPQEGALFPHLTVGENVAFGLRKRRAPEARRRVLDLLELVGLPDSSQQRPSELSGGMQQRVALARALATQPALILLDEPFSALDESLRVSLREQVVAILRAAGSSALWVTHDQDEALSTADTVAVMIDHTIVQSADPVTIYNAPSHVEVARFIGETVAVDGEVSEPGITADSPLGPVRLMRRCEPGRVTLLVRPEQFAIVSDESLHTHATGTVVNSRYFGNDATVDVRLTDGAVITARLRSRDLPTVGTAVGIAVIGDVLAF